MQTNVFRRDYYGGALMMLIGLGAVAKGSTYTIGSLTQMGGGFFPVALGAILALLGILIALSAKQPVARPLLDQRSSFDSRIEGTAARPEWRGWLCILLGVALFALLGKWGGLLPATFATTFVSALGDRDNTWRAAALLALALSVVCVVVFWWALQVSLPLFAWGN